MSKAKEIFDKVGATPILEATKDRLAAWVQESENLHDDEDYVLESHEYYADEYLSNELRDLKSVDKSNLDDDILDMIERLQKIGVEDDMILEALKDASDAKYSSSWRNPDNLLGSYPLSSEEEAYLEPDNFEIRVEGVELTLEDIFETLLSVSEDRSWVDELDEYLSGWEAKRLKEGNIPHDLTCPVYVGDSRAIDMIINKRKFYREAKGMIRSWKQARKYADPKEMKELEKELNQVETSLFKHIHSEKKRVLADSKKKKLTPEEKKAIKEESQAPRKPLQWDTVKPGDICLVLPEERTKRQTPTLWKSLYGNNPNHPKLKQFLIQVIYIDPSHKNDFYWVAIDDRKQMIMNYGDKPAYGHSNHFLSHDIKVVEHDPLEARNYQGYKWWLTGNDKLDIEIMPNLDGRWKLFKEKAPKKFLEMYDRMEDINYKTEAAEMIHDFCEWVAGGKDPKMFQWVEVDETNFSHANLSEVNMKNHAAAPAEAGSKESTRIGKWLSGESVGKQPDQFWADEKNAHSYNTQIAKKSGKKLFVNTTKYSATTTRLIKDLISQAKDAGLEVVEKDEAFFKTNMPYKVGSSEELDNDSTMSYQHALDIKDHAEQLLGLIDPKKDMEDWVDAKITKAREQLLDVTHYLSTGEKLDEKEAEAPNEEAPIVEAAGGKWIIEDWAGNVMFKGKEFKSFEDAEEFLSEKLGDNYETDREEYEIVEASITAAGEPDQDYDKELFDAICAELKKSGYDCMHREFDKYQGIYMMVKKSGKNLGKFWMKDLYYTGEQKGPQKKYRSAYMVDEDGVEVSANRDDYFMMKDTDKFEGSTLFLTRADGTEEEIENPTKGQLPDLMDVQNTIEFKGEPDMVVVLEEEDNTQNEFHVLVSSDYKTVEASDLVEFLDSKSGEVVNP